MSIEHWSDKWIGRPFLPDRYDCGETVRDILQAEFSRDVPIPTARAPGLRQGHLMIQALRESLAYPVEAPREGDGVLMKNRAGLYHVGVCAELGTERGTELWIVHNILHVGICRHRPRELADAGLSLEGYYRWH